jgi:hypothetical protein
MPTLTVRLLTPNRTRAKAIPEKYLVNKGLAGSIEAEAQLSPALLALFHRLLGIVTIYRFIIFMI